MVDSEIILGKIADEFINELNFIKEGPYGEWCYVIESKVKEPMGPKFLEELNKLQKEFKFEYDFSTRYAVDEEIINIEIL